MTNISKKDVIHYKMLNKFLNSICQTYFEQNCEKWQRFVSWSFYGNDDIVITYAYEDYCNNTDLTTEYGEEIVSFEKIIEIGNELYADYLEGEDYLEGKEWAQKIKEEYETQD